MACRIAALVFAAVAAVLVFVALQNRDNDGGAAAADVPVVVAASEISTNTVITEEMLDARSVPADQVLSGAYRAMDAVIGLPARYPIQPGEQITPARIGAEAIEDEKDLALVLESGMRAIAVEATEVSAVGGLLLPGNFVDVIAVP